MTIDNFIDPKDRFKFRSVLFMSLNDFVEWYKINKPGNKPFKELYKNVVEHLNNNKEVEEDLNTTDPIVEKLNKIPFKEILYYVSDAKYNTLRKFFPTLGALYNYEPSLEGSKKHRWRYDAINYQKTLKEKCEDIIDNYFNFNQIKNLPATINKELGFVETFRRALKEFIDCIEKRKGNTKFDLKWADKNRLHTLKYYYLEGMTDDEIGLSLGFSSVRPGERPRQIRKEFLQDFESGKIICSNLRIHDDLKKWIKDIKEQCLFHSKRHLEEIAGAINDKRYIECLDMDLITVVDDIQFVIPNRTYIIYKDLSKSIIETLCKTVEPASPHTIFKKIIASDKCQKINSEFVEEFIYNVISCPEIVEIMDNKMIRIREELLQSIEQKASRLLYDLCQKNGSATTQELCDAYEKKYNVPYTSTSILKKFGFNPIQQRGTVWHYGSSLKPLLDAVKDYIEENKIFYFNDISTYLVNKGYVITGSIRVYITNLCNVDTKDNQHFCHKDYCDDYPDFNWRSQSRHGLRNWILNQVNDKLSTENEVEFKDMLDYIKLQAQNTVYVKDITTRASFTIKMYCGEDKPFIIDGDKIRKNPVIYQQTEFDTIGLRGEKYAFYKLIRIIVANEIKKHEDGKLLLTDAIKIINDNLEEQQERDTIIRAIENRHLPYIGLELCTIDGNRYIVKSNDSELKHNEPDENTTAANYIQDENVAIDKQSTKNESFSSSYSLTIDWELLHSDLLRELNKYSKMMEEDAIDLDKAIDKFFDFIKSSDNSNLSSLLPQSLFKFCRDRNDRFDRDIYFSNLAIFYEGLLYDILKRKGKQVSKRGLRELAAEFPVFAKALRSPHNQEESFGTIFIDLNNKRNELVHGNSLDLDSLSTAKCILDFMALYIYTVAKYASSSPQ